jgi:hypothetical protein
MQRGSSQISRRAAAAGLLVGGCATADAASRLLNRAIARAGGERALRRYPVLHWTGSALVHVEGRVIEISVDTLVEPFSYARSRTAPANAPHAERIMEITAAAGYAVIDGERRLLPEPLVRHERQQYAIYGLMRLVPLLDAGQVMLVAPPPMAPAAVHYVLDVQHPQAPRTMLMFDRGDRLVAAENSVSDPGIGAGAQWQRFLFGGAIASEGISWPSRMQILHRDGLYFELETNNFKALASRPA